MRVICKSGLEGWQCKLRNNYKNFKDFVGYCDNYGVAERLGFRSAKIAWKTNPTIQGSVKPEDFRVVK